ncbi:hypothetical protein [Campylobacter sp. RM12651]|uniref:hypothetical protein n=1 Tax=Campylobacter sp. RM12651 TaxID=1660079 RepID=UPI001EFBB9B6|nr:hypothetical protein [Campylobacter sp. RM12651]ULO03787.1 hypothetical protein AVBRAN_1333 [Campylobacter sp. RM12651]
MITEEILWVFFYGMFVGVIVCFVVTAANVGYFKVKRYYKISFIEYFILDNDTQKAFTENANHKLHTKILERTEKAKGEKHE